jgi:hypothetical protein
MNTHSKHGTLPGTPASLLPLLAFALLWAGPLPAQVPVDDAGNPVEALDETAPDGAVGDDAAAQDFEADEEPLLTPGELEKLVGPVALYPDKLLAIVLPASTYPLEIVQAARFLDRLEHDSNLKPDESWDDSVTALLNYPEVVRMMNDDIDWTWRLGEAVVRQQPDVIAAVESFRDQAYAAGNLKTDERQRVSNNAGTIEIQPIEEDVIYVPYYEPEHVVHYQPRQVYYYYARPYPVYYYPYPSHHSFHSGYFWGVTTAFNIGWTTNHLHVFHHSYWGHPYYGRQYYGHYYRRPSIVVYNSYYANTHRHRPRDHHRDGDYWRPRDGGPRPGRYNARLERFHAEPRERTVEGYRIPDRNGRGVTRTSDRAGFRGNAADGAGNENTANAREGFASNRNAAAERRQAQSGAAARARQADTNVSRDAPIRFRSRDRATTPAPIERGAGELGAGERNPDATRVPERVNTARPDIRPGNGDEIRFRSRSSRDSGTAVRQRTQPTPSAAATEAARARAADRPARAQSTVRREAAPSRAPRTATPAASTRGFQASPGRSAPAAAPKVSRPQAVPRAAPRTSTPRPEARAPTSAPRAAPAPARQERAAPARRSGATSSSPRRSRDR